jgi:hypothetical protein
LKIALHTTGAEISRQQWDHIPGLYWLDTLTYIHPTLGVDGGIVLMKGRNDFSGLWTLRCSKPATFKMREEIQDVEFNAVERFRRNRQIER